MSIEVYFILLLLLIPAYYLARVFMLKTLRLKSRVNIYAAAGALFIAPALYIIFALVFFSIFFSQCNHQRAFNAENWKKDTEGRFEMQADLIGSKQLIGLHQAAVENLLGEPTEHSSPSIWAYDMGMSSGGGFGVVYHTLELHFRGDTVAEAIYIRFED